MIEVDTDPNFPDRRTGVSRPCYVSTNRDIRDGHTIDDLEVGMTVTLVQDYSDLGEADYIATAIVDEIRPLEGDKFGITHFIYIAAEKNAWHDRR